jgi:ATP-binding cassette subfamily B multidrug efflux pump
LREVSAHSTVIIVTVIIVAQRISTIAQADQVIVINEGGVVGAGTHQSLLVDCPTYAEFAQAQSMAGGGAGQQ